MGSGGGIGGPLRLLFDLGHSADYYLFKSVMKKLHKRGDNNPNYCKKPRGEIAEILR
jgi:predicted glycosyltransferase